MISVLIDDAVERYRAELTRFADDVARDPGNNLEEALRWLLKPSPRWDEIARFEVQFWALAFIDDAAREALDGYLQLYRDFLTTLIRRANPALSPRAAAARAGAIAGLIEGSTLFLGPGRPRRPDLRGLAEEIVRSAMRLATA